MVIFVTVLLGLELWSGYKTALHETSLTVEQLSETLEIRLQQVIARTEALLEVQSKDIPHQLLNQAAVPAIREKISQQMARLLNEFPDVSASSIFDANGDLLYSSDKFSKASNIADRPHFKKLKADASSRLVFSDALIARTTGRWSIAIARGIRDTQGKFLGVTTALFDLAQEEKQLKSVVLGTQGSALIRNAETTKLMMKIPFDPEDLNSPLLANNPVVQLIASGSLTGTLSYAGALDKIERIVSYRKLEKYPFYVEVGMAKKDYLAGWYRQLYWTLGLEFFVMTFVGWVSVRLLRAEAREKTMMREMAVSEARYNTLFSDAKEPMLLVNPTSGRIEESNRAAQEFYGYTAEGLEAMEISAINILTRSEIAVEMKLADQEKRSSFYFKHRLSSGEIRDVEVHSGPIEIEGRHLLYSIIHDITLRKESERERNLLLEIIKVAPDFIATSDMQSNIKFLNKAGAALVGFPEDVDWSTLKIKDMHSEPATKRVLEEGIPAVLTKGYWQSENTLLHRNGHEIPVSQLLMVHRDEKGVPILLSTIMRDISQAKQAEAELLRSNSELEQFSYSISHDMRQPLRMISSYLKLLEMGLGNSLDSDQRSYFNFAIDGAKRMDGMMLGLLEYSRVGRKGEPLAWVESRRLLDDAILFLQPAINEAQATVRVEGEWPRVNVRPDEMLRLLQNLIANAIKFRQAGRPPEVILQSKLAEELWQVSVIDNGIGVAPDQIGRLFSVFLRLQSQSDYEGTGIGLALCRKIVAHHAGKIWVESEGEGKGCRFKVEIPFPSSENLQSLEA
jgi:PAS domain S-box-containing protein